MRRRITIFEVAITVLLLIALTMNSVSSESKANVKLGPSDAAKVNLNSSDAAKVNLNHTDAAKVALNPSESMTFPTERALNELIYDDGTAEDAYYMYEAYNGFAVRFTPLSYPVDILTARICFWPDWPDSDHEEFAVYVYDDDGPGGEPGTCLGGPIYYTAIDWGWCEVDLSGPGITIENGDFYILYQQLTDAPDCEGLCTDESLPQYGRSWDYFDGGWELWDEDNYMIRCVVDVDETPDEWTFMVYLAGDNDLETYAIEDFMEMSSVGSTRDVNIVVQFDRILDHDSSYGDWTTTKRFLVAPGMTPTPANALTDLGECNMGDPNTLTDFVDWTMATYPADNYALILWNHDNGCKEKGWVPWNGGTGIARWVCQDWTDEYDVLSLQDLEQALAGKYVDLLGYNACCMHMIEVVYQTMANAGVSVGDEGGIRLDGWPYDTILADLTVTPTMNEYTLGEVIVQRYIESYGTGGYETLSAVDNGDIPGLVTAVDHLAQVLLTKIPGNYDKIQQARNEVEVFCLLPLRHDNHIDLYHFADLIESYVPGTSTAAQAVRDNINNAVFAEEHGSGHPDAHGLAIYFPDYKAEYLTSYENIKFAVDTEWDEFLKKYYDPPTPPPGEDIAVFRDGVWCVDTTGNHNADQVFCYGFAGTTPLVGDINQDGTDDIAIVGAYDGNYRWFVDTNGDHVADKDFWFGFAGTTPLVGDINQDGTDDIAIVGAYDGNYRWFVDTNGDHVADEDFWFGFEGAIPLVGDIDQDGTDDIALVGAYGGNYRWFVDTNGDHVADEDFCFGFAGATPLVGDIDRDGTDDIAIVSAYGGNYRWFVDTNFDKTADQNFWFGFAGAIPLVGDIG